MTISRHAPARIELNTHVIETGFIENAPSQILFSRRLRAELRNDDERDRAPCARKRHSRIEHFTSLDDAALNRVVAAIVHHPSEKSGQTPSTRRGHPLEVGPEGRTIVVEVAIENAWSKHRHDRDGAKESR